MQRAGNKRTLDKQEKEEARNDEKEELKIFRTTKL